MKIHIGRRASNQYTGFPRSSDQTYVGYTVGYTLYGGWRYEDLKNYLQQLE